MSKTEPTPKELLIKSKFYRIAALVFVVLGLLVFMVMFATTVQGHVMDALKNPFTIIIFIVPFLPAAALSMLSNRNEKKYLKLSGDKS